MRNFGRGTVTFNIVNLIKEESLYCNGMKPFVLSRARENHEGVQWHRGGFDVAYKKTTFKGGPYGDRGDSASLDQFDLQSQNRQLNTL